MENMASSGRSVSRSMERRLCGEKPPAFSRKWQPCLRTLPRVTILSLDSCQSQMEAGPATMHLKRFEHFCQYLHADSTLNDMINKIELFRRSDEMWYDEDGEKQENNDTCEMLDSIPDNSNHWRPPKSCVALIRIPPLDAVARVTFQAPPKNISLERIGNKLEELRTIGEFAFDSVHDSLTGILNGKGFLDAASKLALAFKPADDGIPTANASPSAISLGLFAMDIDHFKQVNDTFGHLYGDVVLKCLAKRLDSLAQQFEKESASNLMVRVARPSGEEFLMLVGGAFTPEELKTLADRVRIAIADEPLPSDAEWLFLAPEDAKKTSPPTISSRRVTISVGVAYAIIAAQQESSQLATALRGQADIALYSAKGGGRNAVRLFTEILLKHGHVLQHHPETDIVAIDLGHRVNLSLGQEFHVFHPQFDGTTPFTRNDGRSTKTLGYYPRRAIGQIVAFDVQQEIAFCRVARRDSPVLFPVGSHLEAIPIGSIAHLASPSSFAGAAASLDIESSDQLASVIAAVKADDAFPVVSVYVIDNVQVLLQERGTAFVNEALSQLYQIVKSDMPHGAHIGQIQETEFATISFGEIKSAYATASKIVLKAKDACKGLATFKAGMWCDGSEDESTLKREHALYYARYAASHASMIGESVVVFNTESVVKAMYKLHAQQVYSQAVADYKELKHAGMVDYKISNVAAIGAFAVGDKDVAMAAGREAVELRPDNATIWSNLASYEFRFVGRRAAYSSMRKSWELDPVLVRPGGFDCIAAMACYEEFKAGGAVDTQWMLGLLKKIEKANETATGVTMEEVSEAIRQIEALEQARS